jgi:hypothetical protein
MAPQLDQLRASPSVSDFLTQADTADPDELALAFDQMSSEEREKFEAWAIDTIVGCAVRGIFMLGGVLHVYSQATTNRPDDFKALCQKLGVSKTKAYDAIAIYNRFGSKLMRANGLEGCFPVESLKLLAARTVPEQAADEALQLAASGQRVTIKRAKELREKYTVDADVESPATTLQVREVKKARPGVLKSPAELWAHDGVQVRVVVLSHQQKSLANTFVQHDVAEAFQKFRQACAEAVSHDPSTDAA